MGLLDQIANPQMADIAGALDYREARLARDEAKRKEIRLGQLVAEALPGIRPDSPLYEMAQNSPREFSVFAKSMGIPLNSAEQFGEFQSDVESLYTATQTSGPQGAYDLAQQMKAERNAQGRDTEQLDRLIGGMRDTPEQAFTALFTIHRAANGDNQSSSQSSENLPGGLTKIVMRDGSVIVRDAGGRTLQGDEAVKAISDAEERGVSLQRDIYAAREGGKLDTQIEKKPELEDLTTRAKKEAENATEQSKEYFKAVSTIDNNINNYREGIRLVREEGADTGVLASRLPSMKTAAIKLDNLKNRLGLDVVAGTTFGALSEAELKMALDTAMPTTLQPEEMARWFEDRIAAQEKYKSILDGAIQFLEVPGNTLADLRAMQNQSKASEPKAAAKTQSAPLTSSQQTRAPASSRYKIEVAD